MALLLVVVCIVVFTLSGGEGRETTFEEPDKPGQAVVDPSADQEVAEPIDLPFSIDGVDCDARLVSVVEAAQPAVLAGEWTFGGDYAQIGSFPVDGQTVFGSATDNPNDISSYRAALISPDGVTYLEDAQTGEPFFEPQDGTGTSERLVWRSSEITLMPFSGSDNWRLQTWDRASNESTILGSAELLNGTTDTPAVGGEVVPVFNDTHAFFSSCLKDGESWSPAVVAFDLSEEGQEGEVIGVGNYPAAVDDGALFASNQLPTGDGTLYGALSRWDGEDSTEVFSVSSDDGSWGISGIWACGSHVVVCFSSVEADDDCYLAVWSEDFASCKVFIHAPSPSVVASLNDRWLVWGAGSQAENAGMYALEIESGKLLDLGSTSGYSRPCVAAEGNTVLVPHENGTGAVTFSVGELRD